MAPVLFTVLFLQAFVFVATQGAVCPANPCQNGGTCSVIGAALKCTCTPEHFGLFCQETITTTTTTPATTSTTPPATTTTTTTTATTTPTTQSTTIAHRPDIDIDLPGFPGQPTPPPPSSTTPVVHQCSVNPCFNGGFCISNERGDTCVCSPMYTGPVCETEVTTLASPTGPTTAALPPSSPCYNIHCEHGGACVVTNAALSSWTCQCSGGYSGFFCQIKP